MEANNPKENAASGWVARFLCAGRRRFAVRTPEAQAAFRDAQALLRNRRAIPRDRRVPFEDPPDDIGGRFFPCAFWILSVAWQDRPLMVIAMALPGTLFAIREAVLWVLEAVHRLAL